MDVGHYAHALDMLLNLSLSAPLAQRLSKAAHGTGNPSDLAKITWLIMRQNQALSLDVSNSMLLITASLFSRQDFGQYKQISRPHFRPIDGET